MPYLSTKEKKLLIIKVEKNIKGKPALSWNFFLKEFFYIEKRNFLLQVTGHKQPTGRASTSVTKRRRVPGNFMQVIFTCTFS